MGVISPEELAAIHDLTAARTWSGVPDDVWMAVDNWLGGVGSNLKLFGLVGKDGLQAMLTSLRLPSAKPTGLSQRSLHPTECSQIARTWRVARQKLGMTDEDPMPPSMFVGDADVTGLSAGALAMQCKYHAFEATGPVTKERTLPRKRPAEVLARSGPAIADSIDNSTYGVLGVKGLSYTHGIEAFRTLFANGTDCAIEVPLSRWDMSVYYEEAPNPMNRSAVYTKHGVFVELPEPVDHQFFGITPKDAKVMDPMQRACLKQGYRALSNAKLTRHLLHSSYTGVYTGSMNHDYLMEITGILDHGNVAMLSNRISHCMDLRGPSVFIDTGCSSSLVTADMAAHHVRRARIGAGLALGVNSLLSVFMYSVRCAGNMLSRRGRSQPFDKDSDGYVVGEGCGALVIGWIENVESCTPLWQASQVMQDGRSAQLSAPSGPAQHELLRDTMRRAHIAPEDIAASECQCNGSHMGDPIEMGALEKIHKGTDRENDAIYMLSGKGSKGHGEGLAGATGLVKTCLLLRDHLIHPTVHLSVLNPHIDIDGLPFLLPSESSTFPTYDITTVCGSAFGWGGVNGHYILQAQQQRPAPQPAFGFQFLPPQMQAPMPFAASPTAAAPAPAPAVAPPATSVVAEKEVPQKGLELDYVQALLRETAGNALEGDLPSFDTPLMDSGLDSLSAISFRNNLQRETGLALKGTLMFDYPTLGEIAAHIVEKSLE